MTTQAEFLARMDVPPRTPAPVLTLVHHDLRGGPRPVPEFLSRVREIEFACTHRVEIEKAPDRYGIVARALNRHDIFKIWIRLPPWDSAWLRVHQPDVSMEPAQLARHLFESVAAGLPAVSGWRVYGVQVYGTEYTDAALLYVSPRIPLPRGLPEGAASGAGRPRIGSGLCLQLPLKSQLRVLPSDVLSVARHYLARLAPLLPPELAAAGRANLAAHVTHSRNARGRAHLPGLAEWCNRQIEDGLRVRVPPDCRLPVALKAMQQVDACLARIRNQSVNPGANAAFFNRYRAAKMDLGRQLLAEELFSTADLGRIRL